MRIQNQTTVVKTWSTLCWCSDNEEWHGEWFSLINYALHVKQFGYWLCLHFIITLWFSLRQLERYNNSKMTACITNNDTTNRDCNILHLCRMSKNIHIPVSKQATQQLHLRKQQKTTFNLPGAFWVKKQDQIHVSFVGGFTWLKTENRLRWCRYVNSIKIVTSSWHLGIDYLK